MMYIKRVVNDNQNTPFFHVVYTSVFDIFQLTRHAVLLITSSHTSNTTIYHPIFYLDTNVFHSTMAPKKKQKGQHLKAPSPLATPVTIISASGASGSLHIRNKCICGHTQCGIISRQHLALGLNLTNSDKSFI